MTGTQASSSAVSSLDDLVPDSLVEIGASGTIVAWNAGAQEIYGHTTEAARGQPVDQLLATRHSFGLDHIARQIRRQGRWEGELFRRTADGRSIGVRARMIARPGGGLVEWSRPFSDYSVEEIAAHRYSNLFNAMAASFWELDFSEVRRAIGELAAAGQTEIPRFLMENVEFINSAIASVKVLDVNAKTIELFEIDSHEDALAGPMDWAWPQASRHIFAQALIAALRQEDSFTTEVTLQSRTGRPIDALFTVCWPADHKAQGSVLVGVIDISESRQAMRALQASEQHYRDLFQHMPVALLRLDLTGLNRWLANLADEGITDVASHVEQAPGAAAEVLREIRIVDANAEALRVLGAADLAALEGETGWAFRERPDTVRRSLAARLRGRSQYSEETRVNRRDGTSVDVLYAISFAHGQMEHGRNVIGLIDISERKLAEAELRKTREELSHAARVSMLGELSASIAHEVNQPLTAIATLADASLRWLGRERPEIAEAQGLIGEIAADARRASDIINRIRGFATKRVVQSFAFDLNELITESLVLLRHDADGRGIPMTFVPEAPLAVTGDRVQLQQVVVNLVVNALQAMPEAKLRTREVTVRSWALDDGGCAFAVEDTGPGISPGDLVRLFDSFFTTKSGGTGLGLSVCKSIVEAHGGSIHAENHSAGARFTVSFPAK